MGTIMKIKIIAVLIFLLNGYIIYGCPTCVGTVHHDSPLFFTDELYNVSTEQSDMDSLQTGTGLND